MKLFLLLTLSFQLSSKTYQQKLDEWTELNESNLLSKSKIIEADWFSKSCLELSRKMKFKMITQCNVLDSEKINAYVLNNGHVYFSKKMMQLINNEHQWAFILAHENSHLELNHYILRLKKFEKPGVFFTKTRLNRFMIQQEDEADEWASNYLEQNGFDESQIYYFLNRVLMTQEVDHSGNHKKLKKRIKKISSPEIIDSGFKNLINSL